MTLVSAEWHKEMQLEERIAELEAENACVLEINEELDTKNTDQMLRIQELEAELNMLKGLVDELIDNIDSGDIGQAKKTLIRYGWG